MNPRVRAVRAIEAYRLRIRFTGDEVRIFDVSPYLGTGVFRALRDPAEFSTARVLNGTVAWRGGQDLCPDTLFEGSVPVPGEPRAKRGPTAAARPPRGRGSRNRSAIEGR